MAISDTLSDAVIDIDEYLADDWYGHEGEVLYDRIVAVRHVMNRMRGELDDRSATPRALIDRVVSIWQAELLAIDRGWVNDRGVAVDETVPL